jgi:hypothetical protein
MTQQTSNAGGADSAAPDTVNTISATRIKIKRVDADFIGCAQLP